MTEEQSFMIEAAIMQGFEILDDDVTEFKCTAEQIISLISGLMIESEHDDLIKRLCGKCSCGPKGIREDRDFEGFTFAGYVPVDYRAILKEVLIHNDMSRLNLSQTLQLELQKIAQEIVRESL